MAPHEDAEQLRKNTVDHGSILCGTMFGARPTMAGDTDAVSGSEQHDGSSGFDEVSRGTADQLIFQVLARECFDRWTKLVECSSKILLRLFCTFNLYDPAVGQVPCRYI